MVGLDVYQRPMGSLDMPFAVGIAVRLISNAIPTVGSIMTAPLALTVLILVFAAIAGVTVHLTCANEPAGGNWHGRCDPGLSCPGLFPFVVFCMRNFLGLVVELFWPEPPLLLLLTRMLLWIFQISHVITGTIGLVMLSKRIKANRVPRGCDCCCSFPFPAWSLFLVIFDCWSIDILKVVIKEDWLYHLPLVFIALVSVLTEWRFAMAWLFALKAQDGDICCRASKVSTAIVGAIVVEDTVC